MAAGSASHHLGVLARAGLITPAPDVAGDTRESWWRAAERTLQWGSDTFTTGSAGEHLVQLASQANLDYLLSAVQSWREAPRLEGWDGTVSDTLVQATAEQCTDLGQRLAAVMQQWATECRSSPPQAGSACRPVRAVALVFPDRDLRGRA